MSCKWISVIVALVIVSTLTLAGAKEHRKGCAGENLCCKGKNNTCLRGGPRINHSNSKTCYCDEYCLKTGDCCHDFKKTCTAVDCQLQPWGRWERCSVQCGRGVTTRHRKIHQTAVNGGKACGPLMQRRRCEGDNCKVVRHTHGLQELRETAKIIPAMYGPWRKNKMYDPYTDPIRKNLFHHYGANSVVHRPPYCAKFEITETRKACENSLVSPWARKIKKGATVCVECQRFAMKRKLGVRCRGDGVLLRETRFNALTVPGCHGKWEMKVDHKECSCDNSKEMAFILV